MLSEIEQNLGKTIKRLAISKKDYQITIKISTETPHDWQALIDDEK